MKQEQRTMIYGQGCIFLVSAFVCGTKQMSSQSESETINLYIMLMIR